MLFQPGENIRKPVDHFRPSAFAKPEIVWSTPFQPELLNGAGRQPDHFRKFNRGEKDERWIVSMTAPRAFRVPHNTFQKPEDPCYNAAQKHFIPRADMNASPERVAAERELAMARRSFNTARRALDTSLTRFGAREGATDRIIHHADEYGVDHTLAVLGKTPATFDFNGAVPEREWPAVRAELQAAYDAMHAVDLAMAKVENLARATNPSQGKAILIADRAYLFNPSADALQDRDSGQSVKAGARVIDTEDGGPARKRKQDRNR